jgi:putative SOS response-associated peptidase YedK
MCGRFTLTTRDFHQLERLLDAPGDSRYAPLYRPRYNIAPTDRHWIVRTKYEQRELVPADWGLVNSRAPDARAAARQINARAETVATARAFRHAFERRRCIVPADGFLEWTGDKAARRPLWFHAPYPGELLFLAGIYESWSDPAGARTRTFAIITTAANGRVRAVHDRMPVILPAEALDEWLHVPADDAQRARHASALRELLRPCPDDRLVATPVSTRVNAVANDDPACLERALDEPTPLRLF